MKVLFCPRFEPGAGSGHLRRCLRLARAHGAGAAVLLEQGAAAGALAIEAGVQVVTSFEPSAGWDLVVLDRRASTVAELEHFLPVPVLAVDEAGPARPFVPYLLDCLLSLAGLPSRSPPRSAGKAAGNLRSLVPLELPERKGELRFPFRRLLLSFGGEDPADLSGALLKTLLSRGVFAPSELTVVEGYFFRRRSWPAGVAVLRSPGELKGGLHQYDLVFTTWGLTTVESLAAGVPVVNLNPSGYHRRLSRQAGVPEIGVGRPRALRLSRLLGEPRPFQALRERYDGQRFRRREEEPQAGPGFLRALRPHGPAACPVCGRCLNRAAARFPRRTYFRCGDCGVLYLVRFGGEPRRYDRDYFFSEYQKQYGRTYLEDFQSIKAAARRRLALIAQARRQGRGASPGARRLLDIGCAFGPFLQAATEAGYQAEGIDVSEDAARYVREELGLPCRVADFEGAEDATAVAEAATAENGYDVITLWYVVEHLRDPAAALRRVRTLLRPGGVLALSTPSASGISARRCLRAFLERSPEDHVTVWPTGAAAGILERCGFSLHRLVVTGHHPERFPGAGRLRPASPGARALLAASRFAGLGDTFEVYAVRRELPRQEGGV